ncbi:hypothetical protein [Pseudomonas laurylsulfatiphila]|uniref:hypothetical protein n=1 Tax=Pseudomonas laurylsulfatiphila TaxID=2011015 RepID=UPI003D1CC6B4
MSALKLGRIWASAPTSPNIDPGVDKYKLGWVAEIPVFQMLNYINNRYDTNIVALAERGMFEWGNDIAYKLSSLVWDEADGFIYVSKISNPSIATRPGLNLSQWEKSAVQISRTQYDAAVASWSNHIANTSNPHQLTVEILNTYSKSVIDGKVAVVQGNLNTHTGDHTNPHDVTAVQVGAVPVTGGDYSGLVRHLSGFTGIGALANSAYLLTDASGTYLTLGSNPKLGIDATSKPVFIDDSSVKSNLLIESNYIAARELVEANYVPPTPDCEVNLRNNLNLIYGSGSVFFSGPAGSRGYTDKSGTAQTAALNTPRYTAKGLYVTNSADAEQLSVPTALNLLNATTYTWSLNFQTVVGSTAQVIGYVFNGGGSTPTSLTIESGYYCYRSLIAGSLVVYQIAPVDHTAAHKVTVVSDGTLNKTFVYFDGVLAVTITGKQDYVSGPQFVLSNSTNVNPPLYVNSFKTWLAALTPQQVSNL